MSHVGKDLCSHHNIIVKAYDDLMNQSQHIDKIIHRQTTRQIMTNRLQLRASIDAIRWLTFQACGFRGHDNSLNS